MRFLKGKTLKTGPKKVTKIVLIKTPLNSDLSRHYNNSPVEFRNFGPIRSLTLCRRRRSYAFRHFMFNRKGGGENLGLQEGGSEGESDPLAAEGGRKKINNERESEPGFQLIADNERGSLHKRVCHFVI